MSKILYPIFKLPSENEDDVEYQAIPTWIKWWMINNYKKRNWILSEILTGNPLTLENSVETKFYLPPYPRGNSEQDDISYIDVGTWEQGEVASSTGENTDNSNCIRTSGYIPVVPNIKYNMARTIYTSYMNFRFYDSSKNYIGTQTVENIVTTNRTNNRMNANESSIEITINNTNVAFIRMVDYTNNLSTVYTMSTASPNPSYPQEITNVTGDVEVLVQNKNLFDKSKTQMFSTHFSSIVETSTGKAVTLTSNQTNGFLLVNLGKISNYVGKTLTLSLDNTSLKYNSCCFVNCNSSGGNRTSISDEIGSTNKTTFTVGEDYTEEILAVRLYVSNATGGQTYNIDNIQIEEGTTATTYTPHQEQTYTFPLGTQRMYLGDYLADDGIHHVRKQIELDGSDDEEWRKAFGSIYNNKCLYAFNLSNNKKTTCLSNKFKFVAGFSEWYDEGINVTKSETRAGLILMADRLNNEYTVEAIKSWLQNNPFMLEYELATEEITPYTTEQQTAYDEIKQAISYEEQTNISGSSDEAMPLFEVQYYMINESEGE